ncbi:hypothetical protein POM88_006884 [Heracleum sosnowskyi]|uniref:Replication factor A C-terminal domain-containing protein n=1 Tax=Heracleum sosnowskyi TaxID=360622 RepID=A0AAD8N5Y9_9APIA|nr:hypothetical protein POM88_006884 [Heracleum sosnowskyi]
MEQTEVITHANIRYVDDKAPWYYQICTGCKQQIQFKGGDFICSKCIRRIPEPEKRFKISIPGSDEIGGIEIVLHDREIRTLLGERAETVYQQQQKACTSFPKKVKDLEKTNITVKLLITEANFGNQESVYYANNICKGIYSPETEEAECSTTHIQTTTQVILPNKLGKKQLRNCYPLLFIFNFCLKQQSMSSYHIDGMSELNFQSPQMVKKQ